MSPELLVGTAAVVLPIVGTLLTVWIRSAITAAKVDTNSKISESDARQTKAIGKINTAVAVIQVDLGHVKGKVTDTWMALTNHNGQCDPDRQDMRREIEELKRKVEK